MTHQSTPVAPSTVVATQGELNRMCRRDTAALIRGGQAWSRALE